MLSDRGLPCCPRLFGQHSVVCCQHENIDQIPLNNYFPTQSLHLRYGSAAPCPTLRAHVTTSLPRTRYGRLATPYPTGLPCCVLPAYKDCLRSQWKTALTLFSQFAPRVDEGIAPHAPHGTVRALFTHTALHFISVLVCKTNSHRFSARAEERF